MVYCSVYQDTAAAGSTDDFAAYTESTRSRPQDVPNVIKWWADSERLTPLARLVLGVLSILAMSTECERLFSSASNPVGTTRNSLHDDPMERLELLHQWLKDNLMCLHGEK
jgi:hypothetical protein